MDLSNTVNRCDPVGVTDCVLEYSWIEQELAARTKRHTSILSNCSAPSLFAGVGAMWPPSKLPIMDSSDSSGLHVFWTGGPI